MAALPEGHDAAREASRVHRDALLALPGVTGTFTGEKVAGGVATGQAAVVVSVRRKRDVPAVDRIPATLDGIPTDVIEEEFFARVDDGRVDPLAGGASISVALDAETGGGVGTLGLVVTDAASGDPLVLSNYHVVFRDGGGVAGEAIVQPAFHGGDFSRDAIGQSLRFVFDGHLDCAVASAYGRAASGGITAIGTIAAVGAPAVGMAVQKTGRTTGHTTGTIAATDWAGTVAYDPPIGPHAFTGMVRVTGAAGTFLPGDSGAVLAAGTTGVGLLIASSDGGATWIGSPLADAFAALGIGLYVPPPGLLLSGATVAGHADVAVVHAAAGGVPADWAMWGEFVLLSPASAFVVGVGDPATPAEYPAFFARFPGAAAFGGGHLVAVAVPGGSAAAGTASFRPGSAVSFELTWDASAKRLDCGASQLGSAVASASLVMTGSPTLALPYVAVIEATGSGGAAVRVLGLRAGRECGGGGGGGPLACLDVPAAGWVVDAGSIGDFTFGAGLVSSPNAGAAHSEGAGMGIPAGTSWTLRGTVFADPNNSTQIAMGVDGLAFQYTALVKGSLESIPGVELDTLVDSASDPTDFSGAACPVVLAYDATAQTLTCTFNDVLTLVCSDAGSGVTGTLYPCVRVYDLGLNPLGTGQVSSFQFCTGGEGEVLSPAWHAHYGGWTFVDPSEVHFAGVADAFCGGAAGGAFSGYAYGDGTGMPFDGTQRVRFSGRIAMGGTLTDAAFFVGLQATDETGDSCGFDWGTGTDAFNAYGFPDGGFAAATIPLPSPFDFAIDVDPAAGTISFLLTDPTATATLYAGSMALGTWPAAARSPVFSASGNHCACTFDATDVTVRGG